MSQTTPSKLPTSRLGAGGMVCPNCNGDSFTERSSFKTASEPVLGSASSGVIIDLMNCTRCGADIPAVRGRRSYTLITDKKLSSLVADFEEAQRTNSEMNGLLGTMERRSQSLTEEIERCRVLGEVSVMEERVAALKAETDGLEERRSRLAETVASIASRMPAA
ncbi:MAG: hypothetical protein ACRD6W_07640 [Nitrososphaerales archaeon]